MALESYHSYFTIFSICVLVHCTNWQCLPQILVVMIFIWRSSKRPVDEVYCYPGSSLLWVIKLWRSLHVLTNWVEDFTCAVRSLSLQILFVLLSTDWEVELQLCTMNPISNFLHSQFLFPWSLWLQIRSLGGWLRTWGLDEIRFSCAYYIEARDLKESLQPGMEIWSEPCCLVADSCRPGYPGGQMIWLKEMEIGKPDSWIVDDWEVLLGRWKPVVRTV